MNLRCSDVLSTLSARSIEARIIGVDHLIYSIQPIESCSKGSLTFAEKQRYLASALRQQVAAVVVPNNLDIDQSHSEQTSFIQVDDVRVAMAYIRQQYDDNEPQQTEWPRARPQPTGCR